MDVGPVVNVDVVKTLRRLKTEVVETRHHRFSEISLRSEAGDSLKKWIKKKRVHELNAIII
jgi:hypothetical protein